MTDILIKPANCNFESEIKSLYHYTSIESLFYILKNKTIKFSPLSVVDDLEETNSVDIKNIGKCTYVSCWTYDSEEQIPLWKMYSDDLKGVRIELPLFPFEKNYINKGEFHFNQEGNEFLNYNELYHDDKATVAPGQPQLVSINYTNDENLLYPKVKTESVKQEVLSDGRINNVNTLNISFKNIGMHKRKNWSFQNEIRYIINFSSHSFKEMELAQSKFKNGGTIEDYNRTTFKWLDRILDSNVKGPYESYFLKIDYEQLKKIKILLGPKVSEAQEEIVKMLVEKYLNLDPDNVISKSNLHIR